MFDNYTLRARFYPIVLLFFPFIVLGITYSLHFENYVAILSSLGILGALTYLFSQLGRDQGKKKERDLWESWGGAPTTQLLRRSNKTIDAYTKKRYHEKLMKLCPVNYNFSNESEHESASDEVYSAWTKYLIGRTRDVTQYPLLLKDNTSYGFRRNLWGLKPYAIGLLVTLIVTNYLFWAYKNSCLNPESFPVSFRYSSAALIIILLFWVLAINNRWVRLPAFSYAERLLESIDKLD
jgi:hypothetical protein